MSRNEDYLDNLLTSVTDKLDEFDDEFEQDEESLAQSQSGLDEAREDYFLKEFEEDLQADSTDKLEADFIREFEQELNISRESLAADDSLQPDPGLEELFQGDFQPEPDFGDMLQDDGQLSAPDDMLDSMPEDVSAAISDFAPDSIPDSVPEESVAPILEETPILEEAAILEEAPILEEVPILEEAAPPMPEEEAVTLPEGDLTESLADMDISALMPDGEAPSLPEGDLSESLGDMDISALMPDGEAPSLPEGDLTESLGDMDISALMTEDSMPAASSDAGGEEQAELAAPKGMEGLGDIFGDIPSDDMAQTEPSGQEQSDAPQSLEETAHPDSSFSQEVDAGLSQILSESDDEALAALDGVRSSSDESSQNKENSGTENGQGENAALSSGADADALETDGSAGKKSGKKKEKKEKKKKEKQEEKEKKEPNPNSIWAKLTKLLFGTPEELNPEQAAEYAALRAAAGEEEDPEVRKAKKKEAAELKKQQKKEAAELKKKEKEAAKAEKAAQKAAKEAAKPKKEKKPKDKKPKEPPLPKVPVIMMWTIAFSIMALIVLASMLIGYSTPVKASKEAFDSGDYVTAYEKLQGIKVRKADEKLYQAAATLAGIQTQLNAYKALMEQKQYEMALDALVRGVGRCRLHSADAEEWGVTEQLNELEAVMAGLLSEQFQVSRRSAKKLYQISKRSEYTLQLHEILDKLGYTS